MSAVPTWWGSYRRFVLRLNSQMKASQRPGLPDRDQVYRLVCFGPAVLELIGLAGTAYRSVVVAAYSPKTCAGNRRQDETA
jgi:hypothetical protein